MAATASGVAGPVESFAAVSLPLVIASLARLAVLHLRDDGGMGGVT